MKVLRNRILISLVLFLLLFSLIPMSPVSALVWNPGVTFNCDNEYYSTTTPLTVDNISVDTHWVSVNGLGFNITEAFNSYINLSSIASYPKSSTGWIINWTGQYYLPGDIDYLISGLKPSYDYILYANISTSYAKTTTAAGVMSIQQSFHTRLYAIFDPGIPAELYVSTYGSDTTGTGTLANPYFSLQKAINRSTTGDTISIRGGKYNISGMSGNRGIYLNRSGTDSSHHFTITNYNGENVIFNGSRTAFYFSAGYCAPLNIGITPGSPTTLCTAKNITINGINFSNFKAQYVIRVHQPSAGAIKDDIRITNCSFFNNTNYSISVVNSYTGTLGFTENVEVSNCTFTNITQWVGNPFEGVGFSGVKYGKFMWNTMRNCGKNNFAMTDNTMYCYVHDNRFFVNDSIAYLDDWSTVIGTDGGLNLNVSHVWIFNNYIWANNISGITVDASEHAGGRCENISIYNNVIHTMSWKAHNAGYTNGIQFLQFDATNTSKIKNTTVMYNTVYVHNGTGTPFYTDNDGGGVYQGTLRNCVVANNIFVNSQPTGTAYVIRCRELTTSIPSYILNLQDNCVNRTTGGVTKAYWNGVTGTYYGTDPVNSSPLFVSRWDTQLNMTSPAIGAADIAYTTPYDYAWTARPQAGTYDIGAYERIGGGIIPAAPTATTPGPTSNAVDRSSPIPALNITIEDMNADSMNLYFRSNHTGPWVTLSSNLAVFNGTYQSLLPGFVSPGKKWWSVNVTDGAYWTNKTFNFTFLVIAPPTSGITLDHVRANWTTSTSVNLTWAKGANCTNTYVYRSGTGYTIGTVLLYSGTASYFNNTILDPTVRYYYTLRPYNSVSLLFGNYHNVSLAETDNTSVTTSSSALFKGWMGTDKNIWTNFRYSSSQDFTTTSVNLTTKTEYYEGLTPFSYTGFYDPVRRGQTFTTETTRYYIYVVSFKMFRSGTPGVTTLDLYSANLSGAGAGLPTGAILASTTKDLNSITTATTGEWVNFTLPVYRLLSNTKYALVLHCAGSGANTPFVLFDSPLEYAEGNKIRSVDTGATYFNETTTPTGDYLFRVFGHTPYSTGTGMITSNETTTTTSLIDILQTNLQPGQIYYYKESGNDSNGNMTLGNMRYTLTNPDIPVFLNILPSFGNSSVKISWLDGAGANRTVVVRSNIAYPTYVADGVTVYNDTGSLCWVTNISFNTTYYFSLFSYTTWAGLSRFSSGVHIPWGGITFIVYNESRPWQVINASMIVTDSLGLYPVQFNNIYGYYSFNISQIPYGVNTLFYVSNSSYHSRLYPIDILQNMFYNFSFYLPPIVSPPSGPPGNNTPNSYMIQIITTLSGESYEQQLTVDGARVKIYRYFNTTANYTYIGGFVTDGNGQGSIDLFPFQLYMIKISKDGYENKTDWWTPNIVEQSLIKVFKIVASSVTPPVTEYTDFWTTIVFTASMDDTNTTHIHYYDVSNHTIDTQLYLYEFYNGTTTFIASDSKTGNNSFYWNVSLLNYSRSYIVVLRFNSTNDFQIPDNKVVLTISPLYPLGGFDIEQRIKNVFGDFNVGGVVFSWVGFFLSIIPLVVLTLFDPAHVGIGIISTGFFMAGIQTVLVTKMGATIPPLIIVVIPVLIVIGVLYMLAQRNGWL